MKFIDMSPEDNYFDSIANIFDTTSINECIDCGTRMRSANYKHEKPVFLKKKVKFPLIVITVNIIVIGAQLMMIEEVSAIRKTVFESSTASCSKNTLYMPRDYFFRSSHLKKFCENIFSFKFLC